MSDDPRIDALGDVLAEADDWADGEAITAYVMLSTAVHRFLLADSPEAIRNAVKEA